DLGWCELPVGCAEITDHAQRLVGCRLALLRIEIDQEDQIRSVLAESRLNRVMHLGIGMHRAFPFDLLPCRLTRHAPRAGGRGRIAQSAAARTGLQVVVMRHAVLEYSRFSTSRSSTRSPMPRY